MPEQKPSTTYEEIARDNELDTVTTIRFVKYMRVRWGNPEDERVKCLVGYADEWAIRFKNGMEYSASDLEGQRILKQIGGGKI